MTGKHILDLMQNEGYSVNKMAELIGTSQPNLLSALKHTDVRTGLLEKIAQAMGKPLSFFYGEAFGSVTVTGNNSATAINNSTATASDSRLVDLLLSKDNQLTMAMNQTSKAQAQTDKAQEQMDRILDKYLGKGSK